MITHAGCVKADHVGVSHPDYHHPMAEPTCPKCAVVGVKHIDYVDSVAQSNAGTPWFQIAHCDQCGHVYGVFAKVVHPPPMPKFEPPPLY